MNRIFLIAVLAAVGFGGWWVWKNEANVRDAVGQYIQNGEFLTLQARYTPEQLMEAHRKELLPTSQYAFQEPTIKFSPYLLIDAKYTFGEKGTREGMLLWGLVDGEMVLDTDTWEQTHGFEDAINANATKSDFKILFALARNGGSLSRDQLQKELHIERETLEPWIASAAKKHLIVVYGNDLQLHLENPKMFVIPQTKIKQAFVTKPYNHGQRISRKYNKGQIENILQAAFGPSFAIRNLNEVFLPVYCLCVQNPDGSLLTSYWNAVTGKQMSPP